MGRSVLICEDHQIVIDGVSRILQSNEGYTSVKACKTGAELLRQLQISVPDILILDLNLPDYKGLTLVTSVRQQYPALPVLILTMHQDAYLVGKLMKLGVMGYLLKDFGEEELFMALDSALEGTFYSSPEVPVKMLPNQETHRKNPFLSQREMEIIQLTVAGHTSAEIASKLYLSPHTVNTHRRNIYKKLGLQNVKELVSFAHNNNMI